MEMGPVRARMEMDPVRARMEMGPVRAHSEMDRARSEGRRAVRLAVVGVSLSSICGVRDHAELLANALEEEAVSCRLHWLSRSQTSPRATWQEVRDWTRNLDTELHRDPPDVVLLHYSVFAYSYRGVPLFIHPVLSALRSSGRPLVTLLHELAYPWRRRGWRGTAWALTQRAALIDVVSASSAVLLTVDFQAKWVASRLWLPRRSRAIAPVFSNLPSVAAANGAAGPVDAGPPAAVGLFGYSSEGAAASITLDALRLLEDRGVPAQLRLLGAPGPQSAAGEMWLSGARARRIADRVSFSGILAREELASELAGCDVLLFAETDGPTSRKTTLAASLASGRPVLAIDGPRSWWELARARAAQIVQPTSQALAGAIQDMLADEGARKALGARGRAFAEQSMSAGRAARVVRELLDNVLGSDRHASTQTAVGSWPGAEDRHVERAVR